MRYATKQAAIEDAEYFESAARRCANKAAEFRDLALRIRQSIIERPNGYMAQEEISSQTDLIN